MPTLKAEDAEWSALFAVLDRHPGAQFQVILDTFIHLTAVACAERLARLLAPFQAARPSFPPPTRRSSSSTGSSPAAGAVRRFKSRDATCWYGFAHVSVAASSNVHSSLIFAPVDDSSGRKMVNAKARFRQGRPDDRPGMARACAPLLGRGRASPPPSATRRRCSCWTRRMAQDLARAPGRLAEGLRRAPLDAMAEWLMKMASGPRCTWRPLSFWTMWSSGSSGTR